MCAKKIKSNKRSSPLPSPPSKRGKSEIDQIDQIDNNDSDSLIDSDIESLASNISESSEEENDIMSEDIPEDSTKEAEQQVTEQAEEVSETFKNLQEALSKLRKFISPELVKHFDSSEDTSISLVELLEKLSQEYKVTSESVKKDSEVDSRIRDIRKRIATVYSLVLRSLANVRPFYKTSSLNLFDSTEDAFSKTDDFSREYAVSKMWHPLAQINSRLHRSVLILNRDPTVMGTVIFSETEKEVSEASQIAFRDFYMENMTENYGDDLDELREEEGFNQTRLEMLIDSLESGMALFPESDRDLLVLPSQ